MKKSLYLFLGAVFVASVVWAARYPLIHWSVPGTGAKQNVVQFQITTASAGSSANFVPGVTNTNALGTSSLRFSDVQTTDLTVADDLTVTDDATIAGTLSLSGGITLVDPYSATEAELKASTPTVVGQLYYDETNKAFIVSTGTTNAASFGLIYDGATAPTGW